MQEKDIIVIGAGPAGITAGIYGVRKDLDVLVIESALPGGQMITGGDIKNYPGFPGGIRGVELAELMRSHAEEEGVTFKTTEEVKKIERDGDIFDITTSKEQYAAKTVIIATGLTHKKLRVKGEKELLGRGVSYCATCDGPLFKGRDVIVVGSGIPAVKASLYLNDLIGKVKLVMEKDRPVILKKSVETKLKESNVELIPKTRVLEVLGEEFVTGIRVMDLTTEKERTIDTDGILVEVGRLPNTDILEGLEVDTDEKGYIIVDARQQTSIPGLYAAGDVCKGKVKQIGVAVGQATIAALAAYSYIKGFERNGNR